VLQRRWLRSRVKIYTLVSDRYFNKGVKSLDCPGHVVRETSDKIVVFGEGDDRYDIPKEATE
jgi:hypothetical protein